MLLMRTKNNILMENWAEAYGIKCNVSFSRPEKEDFIGIVKSIAYSFYGSSKTFDSFMSDIDDETCYLFALDMIDNIIMEKIDLLEFYPKVNEWVMDYMFKNDIAYVPGKEISNLEINEKIVSYLKEIAITYPFLLKKEENKKFFSSYVFVQLMLINFVRERVIVEFK